MGHLQPKTIRLIGHLHTWVWKITGGKLGDAFGGAPLLLLTTQGRKSGRQRTTPVLYLEDGDDVIVVASFGGNDANPAWYLNLLSNPQADIVIKGKRRHLIAHEVSTEEKQRIWPRLTALYPNFAIYQQRTRRDIPVLKLSNG
jgi:deazaflavin-dependent oxidoreductase (nitroreductase family)